DWTAQIQGILTGENYHSALVRLAAKMLTAGMSPGAAINMLQALMENSEGPRDGRWAVRYADIPRAVETARKKYATTTNDKHQLPKLVTDSSDPAAAAKQLAELIAQRDDFLFNGNWPVHIMAEAGGMPKAVEVTKEAVRVLAHEICNPVKI